MHKDLGLLLTTSGSTGSPKLVRLSFGNVVANAESIADYLSIDEGERPITVLPMHYTFGLSIINSHLIRGATILLTKHSLMERTFWSFFREQQATSFSGVPYTFQMLKRLRFFNMDMPHLRTITQAGGRLDIDLNHEYAEFCARKGVRFFVMYGQTEATARMSYLPPEHALAKLGSVGVAIPGGAFSLVDDAGQTIDRNDTTGELIYSGPNVSMGYAVCREDLAKGDENQGVLATGDLARRDKDGFYTIVGRKKRFIKLFGNRVNLDEAERIVSGVAGACACTGSDDRMVVYVTRQDLIQEVKALLPLRTGINTSAFDVRCIEQIPVSPSGKTLYAELEY